MSDHENSCEWVDSVGAYTLGGLSPDEQRRLESHVRTCETCRREVDALASVPAFLDVIPATRARQLVNEAPSPATSATGEGELLLAKVRAERKRGRGARLLAHLAVAACLLGLGGVVTDQWRDRSSQPTMSLRATGTSAATVGLRDRPWGTELSLDARHLPKTGELTMWVVGPGGKAQNAATWMATPTGVAKLTAPAPMHMADVDQVVIKAADGSAVANVDVRAR